MPDPVAGVRVLHLVRPYSFVSPFEGDEFALLLLVSDPGVTADEQTALSMSLVASGCRYACCAGHGSSSWDDSIDLATVISELDGERSPARTVMTTWHDEPLEEAAHFFLNHTAFDDLIPQRRLAIALGGDQAAVQGLRRALQEAAGHRAGGSSAPGAA